MIIIWHAPIQDYWLLLSQIISQNNPWCSNKLIHFFVWTKVTDVLLSKPRKSVWVMLRYLKELDKISYFELLNFVPRHLAISCLRLGTELLLRCLFKKSFMEMLSYANNYLGWKNLYLLSRKFPIFIRVSLSYKCHGNMNFSGIERRSLGSYIYYQTFFCFDIQYLKNR